MERQFVKRDARNRKLIAGGALSPAVLNYIMDSEVPKPCRHFLGRENELEKLHAILEENSKVFLYGIAGIGKSELAKAYAKTYRKEYTNILYLMYSGDLRQDIIWNKPNPMPESVRDRCTKSHEYIFLLSKSEKYYYDYEAIMEKCSDADRVSYQCGSRSNGINKDRNDNDMCERSKAWKPKTAYMLDDERGVITYPVRNKRDVWSVTVKPCKEAHFATYPTELIKPCILAGCRPDGIVLDPFMGSGTTAIVAKAMDRNYLGIELNPEYIDIANKRLSDTFGIFL